MCISAVPVAVGVALGVGVKSPVVLAIAVLRVLLLSARLALLRAPNLVSNIMMLSTFVKFPMIFISGIFIPLDQMPGWGVAVASLSPLTYFTDLARYSIQGSAYAYYCTLISPLIYAALFLLLAVRLHERALPRRF